MAKTSKAPHPAAARRSANSLAMLLLCVVVSGCAAGVRVAPPASVSFTIAPGLQILESASGRMVNNSRLLDEMSRADVIFFGEFHDDSATHAAQLQLLSALSQRRNNWVLSLEMFERDVQPGLNSYLAGATSEADFLANARPWPRYSSDYRSLVEFARTHNRPVIAANIPRPLASEVSRRGLSAMDSLPAAQRAHVAAELYCPLDAYYERFAREMPAHGSGDPADTAAARAIVERYYQAQCVKDETMAESIVVALRRAGSGAVVIHMNGAFHSDYRQGTVQRVLRRDAALRVLVLTAVPGNAPANAATSVHRAKADFVIFAAPGF
jgi:uncharacterized iron-regulated protein